MPERLPLLTEGAAHLGFTLSERQLEQFQLYYEMLADWNKRINLTSLTGYEDVQVRHFLDSLTVGAALLDELAKGGSRSQQPPDGFSLLDVGTGGGFPGLPLKIIWPGVRVVLADSIAKKGTFLKAVAEALDLQQVEVVTARAEELGADKAHRERYNAVTARAVAAMPVLCEYCLPLVKVGGHMLAPKKGDISLELEGARKAAKVLGGGEPRRHPFVLAGEEDERYVIVVGKIKPTPPGYPRRVGLARSRPLGSVIF